MPGGYPRRHITPKDRVIGSNPMKFVVDVPRDELMIALVDSLSQTELYKLIVELDARVADWDFTEKLVTHFWKLHQQYKQETKDIEKEDKEP